MPRYAPEDYVLLVCPTCHTRMHPHVSQCGKKITCPDCGVHLRVPVKEQRVAVSVPADRPDEIGEYGVQAAVQPVHVPMPHLLRTAEIYAEPLPTPPRWTFFSGVFEFPWYSGTWSRWLMLSLGLAAVGLLVAAALALTGVAGGGVGAMAVVGIGFLSLPFFWMFTWTGSYAAACCMAVVEDTALGNDAIIGWPPANWREWFFRLLSVSYMLLVVAAIAAGVGAIIDSLVEWTRIQSVICFLAVAFVLFPVMLLSSMETGTLWMPVSPVILRSLVVLGWAWFIFYAEAALLAAIWFIPVWLAVVKFPFLTAIFTAPVLAAVLFIYARLLGRLAWKITDRLG